MHLAGIRPEATSLRPHTLVASGLKVHLVYEALVYEALRCISQVSGLKLLVYEALSY